MTAPFESIRALFERCYELDGEAREKLLASAAPDVASEVRQLLEISVDSLATASDRALVPVRTLDAEGRGLVLEVRHGDRRLALKMFRCEAEDGEAILTQWIEQVQALGHAAIVPVRFAGLSDRGVAWFASDLVEPRTRLADMDAESRTRLAPQLEGVLQNIRAHGIDAQVTERQVLVDGRGELRLTELGITAKMGVDRPGLASFEA